MGTHTPCEVAVPFRQLRQPDRVLECSRSRRPDQHTLVASQADDDSSAPFLASQEQAYAAQALRGHRPSRLDTFNDRRRPRSRCRARI
jgi:hypothetical protein